MDSLDVFSGPAGNKLHDVSHEQQLSSIDNQTSTKMLLHKWPVFKFAGVHSHLWWVVADGLASLTTTQVCWSMIDDATTSGLVYLSKCASVYSYLWLVASGLVYLSLCALVLQLWASLLAYLQVC